MQKNQKKKMPVGIILILVYLGFGILGQLQSLFKPVIQLGPKILTGIGAIILILIMLVLQIFLFYGIIKRAKWARTLGIAGYTLLIMLGLTNLISLISNKEIYNEYLLKALPANSEVLTSEIFQAIIVAVIIGIAISLILSTMILFYLVRKKDYFYHSK